MRLQSLLRRRPSPALAISLVALFVSLGGVGYAAIRIPNHSVGTAQLRNGAVTNAKLRNNSVGRAKVRNAAVSNAKLANNSVGRAKIRNGAVSNAKLANAAVTSAKVRAGSLLASDFAAGQLPQGPRGPQGPAGPSTLPAVTRTVQVFNFTESATARPLNLPTGNWLVVANVTGNVSTSQTSLTGITCTLTVGGTVGATVTVPGTFGSFAIPLQLAGRSNTATVGCNAGSGRTVTNGQVSINALPVSAINNQ